ncbi:MAG: phenylacetaldoxime dehydratase family protein [Cellvibrionaceae bacterium]
MVYEINYPRTIDARRPDGHEPRAPRYRLTWDKPISGLACAYFGMQGRASDESIDQQAEKCFLDTFDDFFTQAGGVKTTERLRCVDSFGYANTIIVAYWSDMSKFACWLEDSGFRVWFNQQALLSDGYGYWFEPIVSHFDRHETIYSESSYKIGMARLPETQITSMTMNGYFGAARDRLPISAIDPLDSPVTTIKSAKIVDCAKQKHLLAFLPHNLTILRSGQFWEDAGQEQADDYIETMQPKLDRGMEHLKNNPSDTGCLSLRIATNIDNEGKERAETSTIAAFQSLELLEKWAASHETHLAIYHHAIKMNRHYGKDREVVTWHELFVLQHGSTFEYIHCHPETGMLPYTEVMVVASK